jgi:hypothetical protein
MWSRRRPRTVNGIDQQPRGASVHDLRVNDPTAIGMAFAHAVGAGDAPKLRELFSPDIRLRAVTPSRSWELDGPDEAIDTVIGRWFGGANRVEEIASVSTELVGDVVRVGYRFRASSPSGAAVVEQQAYFEIGDGVITAARIACSGYRPLTAD